MTDKTEITVFIDSAQKRAELPECDDSMSCPHCGGETEVSFGLAGGGYGAYTYCLQCGEIVSKSTYEE